MALKKLPIQKVRAALVDLTGWAPHRQQLHRSFLFADFKEAMAFVNRVAKIAEKMKHHPDFDVRYSRVDMTLATHDAGGITTLDLELARRINATFR